MQTDAFNHAPAQIFMNTGAQQFGRPSLGAWTTYGLGSEAQDLPGFVVFSTGEKGTSGGTGELGLRLPADGLPGRAVPRAGRSGPLPLQPRRRRPDDAARHARRDPQPERAAPRRGRRPRDRDAHQLVRDGLPHAVERAGADGPLEGIEGDARDVRRGAGQIELREQLPAGAAPGRARRALRPDLPRGLGPPRRARGRAEGAVQEDRPGQRGAGQGPEAARPARRHAGDLGRRVRPHADGPGRQRRPRPSPERVHDVARGRRREARD